MLEYYFSSVIIQAIQHFSLSIQSDERQCKMYQLLPQKPQLVGWGELKSTGYHLYRAISTISEP